MEARGRLQRKAIAELQQRATKGKLLNRLTMGLVIIDNAPTEVQPSSDGRWRGTSPCVDCAQLNMQLKTVSRKA